MCESVLSIFVGGRHEDKNRNTMYPTHSSTCPNHASSTPPPTITNGALSRLPPCLTNPHAPTRSQNCEEALRCLYEMETLETQALSVQVLLHMNRVDLAKCGPAHPQQERGGEGAEAHGRQPTRLRSCRGDTGGGE